MSTKSTILLTDADEHWYSEMNGKYYEHTETERAIVLEFSPSHRVEIDEYTGWTRVIIEDDQELYRLLHGAKIGDCLDNALAGMKTKQTAAHGVYSHPDNVEVRNG